MPKKLRLPHKARLEMLAALARYGPLAPTPSVKGRSGRTHDASMPYGSRHATKRASFAGDGEMRPLDEGMSR